MTGKEWICGEIWKQCSYTLPFHLAPLEMILTDKQVMRVPCDTSPTLQSTILRGGIMLSQPFSATSHVERQPTKSDMH